MLILNVNSDEVAATLATTPVFNGFFRTMDDVFSYGLRGRRHDYHEIGDPAVDAAQGEWWSLNLPSYGIDSTIGAQKDTRRLFGAAIDKRIFFVYSAH